MKPIYLYGIILVLSVIAFKFWKENKKLKSAAAPSVPAPVKK